MNTNRDKFLTEAMDLCWHTEWTWHDQTFEDRCERYSCNKCGKTVSYSPSFPHIDFSTWEGFGKLVKFAEKESNKASLLWDIEKCIPFDDGFPDRFADAVYQYLKDKIK